MKIPKKNRLVTKKRLLGLLIGLAVILVGLTAFTLTQQQKPSSDTKTTTGTEAKDSEGTDESSSPQTPDTKPTGPPDDHHDHDHPPHTGPDEPLDSPEAPLLVSAEQNGSTISIVATLQERSTGACEALLQHESAANVRRTAKPVFSGGKYYCHFSLAATDLPRAGTWSVTVLHKEDNGVANSQTKELEVTK